MSFPMIFYQHVFGLFNTMYYARMCLFLNGFICTSPLVCPTALSFHSSQYDYTQLILKALLRRVRKSVGHALVKFRCFSMSHVCTYVVGFYRSDIVNHGN